MIFLGYAFAGGTYSLDPTPVVANDITSITIQNGIYDYLYATLEDAAYSTICQVALPRLCSVAGTCSGVRGVPCRWL